MVCEIRAIYGITLMPRIITTPVMVKSSVLTYAIYSVPISSVCRDVEKSWRFFTDTRPLFGGYFFAFTPLYFYPNPLCLSPRVMIGSKNKAAPFTQSNHFISFAARIHIFRCRYLTRQPRSTRDCICCNNTYTPTIYIPLTYL